MFIFEAANALAKEKTFLPITTRFEFVSLDKQNIDHEPIKLADGADLYIGLDSEWVTRNGSNKVLSCHINLIASMMKAKSLVRSTILKMIKDLALKNSFLWWLKTAVQQD